jgi:Tol biopolymer transport system component/Iap family predicted aminopeptidase
MKSQAAEPGFVRSLASLAVAFVVVATSPSAAVAAPAPEPALAATQPAEPHLTDVRRLTEGGENAEAYWAPDGKRLIFQRTSPDGGCDQIYRLDLDASGGAMPAPLRLSSGRGRTTCGYFLPDDGRFLYSTTEIFAPECPAPPDRSRGYVWAVYDSYEIVLQDGAGLPRRLTDNRAYDAEATVCPRDGSIVFTSDRDGDLELYRMDADGSHVVRLTNAPGYDGGAFFSPECSRIVWRAARPQGTALDEARALLAQHLVKPSQLELWTARADGSEAQQVTYLGVASFAPSFFPSGDRIVFASNLGDPKGREFDLWAIDLTGTRLERITASPGFDGFPMFSPDGTRLAFGTNRFVPGGHETDVAVALWVEAPPRFEEGPADRFLADVRWLADDAREGRGVGTGGLAAATEWLAGRFREIGLAPGVAGGFHQPVQVPTAVRVEPGTALRVDGRELVHGTDFEVAGFSATGSVAGDVVPVGYGIVASEQGRDDYAGIDVQGKVALARRFVPSGDAFADPELARRHGDLRAKAFAAREHGAVALLVVDLPEAKDVKDGQEVEEAPLPGLRVEQRGDAGIPVLVLRREAARALFAGAHRAEAHHVEVDVRLAHENAATANVVGVLRATAENEHLAPVVLGAHYDHLGHGGQGSLAPESHDVHNGADDNASGVAALLETARLLAATPARARDVWFVAFTGEEEGLFGSTEFVRHPPKGLALESALAMLNFDMVGRLRSNRVSLLGGGSASEWSALVEAPCRELGLDCQLGSDGYGPSDQTPFYAAGMPVLHFFTGAHDDYHKPSDDTGSINAAGGARVADLAARVVRALAARDGKLTYQQVAAPAPSNADVRSYGASLGTIPDYVGPTDGAPGVLLAGTRPGGPAEKAGLRRGDLLVELAGTPIRDVNDFMFVLRRVKPGQTSTAVVVRDGQRVTFEVTFDVSRRR